eukprot:scaffold22869_cov45-Phaeocystis_antarctica.AAC.2
MSTRSRDSSAGVRRARAACAALGVRASPRGNLHGERAGDGEARALDVEVLVDNGEDARVCRQPLAQQRDLVRVRVRVRVRG